MLANHRRRQDFAAGNHFSFSSPSSDHLDYGAWAESIKTTTRDSFGPRDPDRKFGPWVRRSSAGGDEDALSPPLWKSSSPETRASQSRAQVIAKYRQEMMDLVRSAPETAYELSLRDIVELPRTARGKMSPKNEEEVAVLTERVVSSDSLEVKKEKRKGNRRLRSSSRKDQSVDGGGFLLKMFMPAAIGGGRRRNFGDSAAAAKVSPKPIAAAAAPDGEWSSCEFGLRSSSDGSSNSSRSCRNRSRWRLSACFFFFYRL